MDDLLREFLTETSESLAQLDVELVRLEQNPNDPALLSSIFRLVHTIKGTCGFIGLPRLEHVAHAGENVLGKFRDGELSVTPHAVSLILQSIDTIKALTAALEATGAEPAGDDEALIAALNAMAEGKTPEVATPVATPKEMPPPPPAAAAAPPVVADEDDIFKPVPAADTGKQMPAVAAKTEAPKTEVKPTGDDHGAKDSVASQSIRVSVELLENLMTTVSELVLTRNQLMQTLRTQKDSPFAAPLQRLNLVTSELQEGVMKTRMQPIGNAWSKLPRIVRDLSVELGKKIDLQMNGAETELDRQVLELIKDPLTHMVRNSGDHGIETPADRLMVGKPETGTIILNAYHEGGHIIIEIADDGRGLALDKIKAKALQNGVTTEAELASMTDQQVMQFIFKAGFSTAAKVTSVSGRGVGMDVVKTNIEKIGGTIELNSVQGKGSRFLIKIPLTLAIVSALIVECSGERFAIPQISVVELVHASPKSEYRIERIKDTPVLRLRNRLLPLVSLRRMLQLEQGKEDSDTAFIVVIQVGTANFGVIVDRVFDTEEIVVKPVTPILRHITMFSGNTILGDGSVVMILDPNGIASQAGELRGTEDTQRKQQSATAQIGRSEGKQSLLLFTAGTGAPKAVPLSLVARLEDFDCKNIELSDGKPVIQYRGKLMPLVPIDETWCQKDGGTQPVLVFTDKDRSMGLIVDEILDIIEDRLQIDLSGKRAGFLGSAILSGKATDIIDTGHFLAQSYQDWFHTHEMMAYGGAAAKRVLLVDDSPFFRNLLGPLLEVAGYDVTAVDGPPVALKLYEDGAEFDAIISDIEMPVMNGFEFVAAIRASTRWKDLPVVALSSHATPRDFERGRQAGFTDYVAKFNREALLTSLQQLLQNLGVTV